MTLICQYCDRLGHRQEDCDEWQRDELLRLSYRAKHRPAVLSPMPESQHQTAPGRMTFTTLRTAKD